ncbi:hypothetical protein C8Q78DRAFT_469530 [Trametes maxima]|nr:hypothetical protein C8Q78DRAFT_469530 [Trametes maxima]
MFSVRLVPFRSVRMSLSPLCLCLCLCVSCNCNIMAWFADPLGACVHVSSKIRVVAAFFSPVVLPKSFHCAHLEIAKSRTSRRARLRARERLGRRLVLTPTVQTPRPSPFRLVISSLSYFSTRSTAMVWPTTLHTTGNTGKSDTARLKASSKPANCATSTDAYCG